ncbi:14.7 kDa ribonuclease H-like protein [bacterium BMS3Abin10]|nr:14.7 kDa ribonuclease H-like protein [bacterium BMS3Abin10]GBE37710.1 14.7 kDa ribonuclease H-like protein [bacterium BMS3Bbin08]
MTLIDSMPGEDNLLLFEEGPPETEAELYCDGASSGNPGDAGTGVVIRFKDRPGSSTFNKKRKISRYIGVATNNVAEYTALVSGLKEARALGLKRVSIFLDSELLVKQLTGVYKIKSPHLRPFWEEAGNILKKFDSYTIAHVRREFNTEADKLARDAVKKNSGKCLINKK